MERPLGAILLGIPLRRVLVRQGRPAFRKVAERPPAPAELHDVDAEDAAGLEDSCGAAGCCGNCVDGKRG